MPRKEWRNDVPELSVKALSERESPISTHFSKPEVQCIGSTSDCGCDFPHVMFQNGEWPWFKDEKQNELDRQREATEPLSAMLLQRSTKINSSISSTI